MAIGTTTTPSTKPTAAPSIQASRETWTLARLVGVSFALTAGLVVYKGLTFPLADLLEPLGFCSLLLSLAAFYYFVRPAENFVLCLKALAVLVAFSSTFSVLMYVLATTGRPLADPWLARADAALSFSADTVVRWVNARPLVEWGMRLAYFSLIPQTILTIVWLGLSNKRQRLDTFLVRFVLTALICAIGFYWMPAMGTCASFDVGVQAHHRAFVEHITALREGTRTLVSWRGAEGLITFPSFHTIWAVLLAAAFWQVRYIGWPIAALNALVIASTITTGMHYLVDVLAGLVVSAVVIWCTRPAPTDRVAQSG